MIDEIERGLRGATLELSLRLLAGAAVLGGVASLVVAGRRLPFVIAGILAGVITVGGGLLITASSFNTQGFEDATYSGALRYAPQVLEAVNRTPEALEDINSRFATAADRLTRLMALVAQPLPDPQDEDTTALLHISDIHSNPLGIEIARTLASDFAVDAVVDTGDLTSFGQPVEARIGRLLDGFPVPYVFVPGNHDSAFNRAVLDEVEGVELLDGESISVEDIEILGWADPTFTASNETTTEEGNATREAEATEVAAAVAEEQPDVLAVHDERLALESVGEVPLVLSGHTHERSFQQSEETLLLTVGSTGATGLGSFVLEADRPYEAEIVYLQDGRTVAVDYLTLSGLGGDFTVERRTIDPES